MGLFCQIDGMIQAVIELVAVDQKVDILTDLDVP